MYVILYPLSLAFRTSSSFSKNVHLIELDAANIEGELHNLLTIW